MSYQDGFRDCLDVIERLLLKNGIYTERIEEIIAELRASVAEKKTEVILRELGL